MNAQIVSNFQQLAQFQSFVNVDINSVNTVWVPFLYLGQNHASSSTVGDHRSLRLCVVIYRDEEFLRHVKFLVDEH